MSDQPGSLKSKIFSFLIGHISMSRLALPLVIASAVGCLTGLLIVGFVWFIEFCQHLFMVEGPHALSFLGPYAIIFIPAIGGLVVGLIVTYVAPEAKGHGVPEVMKAVALRGGKIRPIVVVAKAIASALAIGSGASVGREGPIVQVGSALGSNIARVFKFSETKTKNLVACGAAAGIAGVFNAPIAGVMFSLEVILRDFGARALSTVVVAAVSSSIISRIFIGETPAFVAPAYSLWSPWEIFLYLTLGIFAAFTALIFSSMLHKSENIFEKLKMPDWLKPALGGLILGCVGFFFPQVFGSGLETIESVLHGELGFQLLITLVVLKMFATSLSLGSGTSGGVFAPALFLGAVLGGAVGHIFYFAKFPFPVAPPGAYALVGMASVFSGAAHAPVTAILIVFEMTGDYRMILPIMFSVVVATSLAQYLRRESIYTEKLARKGIDIDSLEEVHVLGALLVKDAMTKNFLTVPRSMPFKDVMENMAKERSRTTYVVNKKEELVGTILPEKIQEMMFEKELPILIADDLMTPLDEVCFPDDPLTESAHIMMHHQMTQMPVLDPNNEKKVIGVLKSESVFRAYTEMSVKREDLVTRLDQQEAAAATVQMHFVIPNKSPLVGKMVKELGLPQGVVLTSVQRRKKTILPKGDTEIKVHDQLWAIVMPDGEEPFRQWLKKEKLDTLSFLS